MAAAPRRTIHSPNRSAMHVRHAPLLWPPAALALAAALALPGGGDLRAWAMRFATHALATLAIGAIAWLILLRSARQQAAAERYLALLGRQDFRDLTAMASASDACPVDERSPWFAPLERVREALLERSARVAELELARASYDLRARRATAEAERAMRIVSGLPEPVVAVDGYDTLLVTNTSAEKLFGQTPPEGQRTLKQWLKCERLVTTFQDLRRHRGPTSRTEEIEIDSPEGQPQWYSVTTTKIEGADDSTEANCAVAVLRDITAQKASQRQNAEFVSAASHEMKTPLAGIKAYVELLADGDAEDEETREEFLEVINGQADRLQRLIDNLLNIARIEAGVVKVSKQSQSLNDLLAEAFRVIQPSAEAKSIELVQDLSPLYLGVLVDRDMLLQAAINLLSNAVKYTPRGGRVTLRSRLLDPEVRFEVEDTGVGLSPEDRLRVFEKFYRVEKDKQMAQGTGLGLPLAKYIVEDVHNGRLIVDSQLGVGSTFQVVLPGAIQMG